MSQRKKPVVVTVVGRRVATRVMLAAGLAILLGLLGVEPVKVVEATMLQFVQETLKFKPRSRKHHG